MSKVIKSASVQIKSPRVVEHRCEFTDIAPEEVTAAPGDQENQVDITALKEQAGQILAETETMVRELLDTARSEADKIIKSAHEEARRIVAEGREQARLAEDQAAARGRQTGLAEGRAKAEEEYRGKLEDAGRILESAHEERRQILSGAESEMVNLVVAVAKKVIGSEVEMNHEVILTIVKRAVAKATDREELTVRVNPVNMDTTINARDEITASVMGIGKLKIIADPAVSAGGCVVESPNGTVDARIERQLSEIAEALTEASADNGV